jgi:putative membrane protein
MWPSCHVSGVGSWGGWDLAGVLLGTVGPLLFLVALAGLAGLAVVLITRQRSSARNQPLSAAGPGPVGREIAQARYARGEISREQYRALVSELSAGKAGEP